MAIKEVKRYWESCQLDYVKEFLCHTEKDVEQLPACCVGSKAYVTETGNWYACGKDQTWKLEEEATEEGGTGGGSASLPKAGAYQQLVTDGAGKWVPVDRLAYKEGEKVEITWDGNTDGLISVDGADGTAALYKVSDLLLDDTVIKAGVIFLSNGASVNVDPVWEGAVSAGLITEDIVFLAEMGVVFVRREGVSAFGFTFTETGVYFYAAKSTDSVTNYTARFVSDNQTTHPIPAECITGAALTSADNGKVLAVVDGAFKLVTLAELQS